MYMQPRELPAIHSYRPRGDDDGQGSGEQPLELGMNENPLGPSPKAIEAVARDLHQIHRYPSGPHADLDEALASRLDVEVDQIWLGAGAVSVIDTITRAMVDPGEAILRPDPGFSYFGRSNRSHYGTDRTYRLKKGDGFQLDVDELLELYDGEPILYLNTPHNPTGATISKEAIREVVAGTDDETLIVVDEAYELFSTEPSPIELVDGTDRVALLRTFSKSYGLAGARIGYGVMPPSIAEAFGKVSTPFGVSRMALVAALGALEDDAYLERSVSVARAGRSYLRDAIDCRTWPSEGNFVLVEVGNATEVSKQLEATGLKVRDCTSFGLSDCVRVTVGTPAQNRRAAAIINRVVT